MYRVSFSWDPLQNSLIVDSLIGEGNSTSFQYSCLENPMDGGPWWDAVHGVAKNRTRLSDFTFTFMHWRRKWQPTPVFLPGESQGWGSRWAAVYGVAQSWTWLKRLSSSSSRLFDKSYPHKCKVTSHSFLVCISLGNSDTDQLSMFWLSICMFSLGKKKCLFKSFAHFLLSWLFFILSCMSSLYILDFDPCQWYNLQIFYPIP